MTMVFWFVLLAGMLAPAAADEWRTTGATAFGEGTLDGVEITPEGGLRLVSIAGTNLALGTEATSLGDKITAREQVGETMRKNSKRVGAVAFNTGLVTYTNQRKELVATIKTLMARYENTGGTMEYDRAPKTETQLEPADPLVWERERRGGEVLYWEQVEEGEELPTLKKGTYSVTELFLFTHGALGTGRASRAALQGEGSADLGGGGRFDEEHAQKRRNMPGQFDFGPQRVCWLSQIVTDWMGDDGTLRKLNASIRHPNVVGDTNTVHGEVVKKTVELGEHLVEVRLQNLNQSGLATALGTAIVSLPSGSH